MFWVQTTILAQLMHCCLYIKQFACNFLGSYPYINFPNAFVFLIISSFLSLPAVLCYSCSHQAPSHLLYHTWCQTGHCTSQRWRMFLSSVPSPVFLSLILYESWGAFRWNRGYIENKYWMKHPLTCGQLTKKSNIIKQQFLLEFYCDFFGIFPYNDLK